MQCIGSAGARVPFSMYGPDPLRSYTEVIVGGICIKYERTYRTSIETEKKKGRRKNETTEWIERT